MQELSKWEANLAFYGHFDECWSEDGGEDLSLQVLPGVGGATQGWNQQLLLHLHLHASPCVPMLPVPPCFMGLRRPPMPFPAAQPLVGRCCLHHLDLGIHCPGLCRLRGISPPSSSLHLHHCWCYIHLPPVQNRLHRQSKHPYPNPTAMPLL